MRDNIDTANILLIKSFYMAQNFKQLNFKPKILLYCLALFPEKYQPQPNLKLVIGILVFLILPSFQCRRIFQFCDFQNNMELISQIFILFFNLQVEVKLS